MIAIVKVEFKENLRESPKILPKLNEINLLMKDGKKISLELFVGLMSKADSNSISYNGIVMGARDGNGYLVHENEIPLDEIERIESVHFDNNAGFSVNDISARLSVLSNSVSCDLHGEML